MKHMQLLTKLLAVILLTSCYPAPKVSGQFTDTEFNEMATKMADGDTPDMTVAQLKSDNEKVILLDAREKKEYELSHIEGAIWVGYDDFDINRLPVNLAEDQKIVVYCSVGYRSERIGEKILKSGKSNVYNLKGSIFQWVNEGNPVVNRFGKETNNIHGFDSKWSKWLKSGNIKY